MAAGRKEERVYLVLEVKKGEHIIMERDRGQQCQMPQEVMGKAHFFGKKKVLVDFLSVVKIDSLITT